MTHDPKLVEAVAIALCPEDECCGCPDMCPDGWNHMPPARAALDAVNAAGYVVVPVGDIIAFRDAGMAVRRAAREADNAFSVAAIIAARLTAAKEGTDE